MVVSVRTEYVTAEDKGDQPATWKGGLLFDSAQRYSAVVTYPRRKRFSIRLEGPLNCQEI